MRSLPILAMIVAWITIPGCSSKRTAPEVNVYNMGDKAQAGTLTFTIFDARWESKLGEGASARTPANRFLIVHLSVSNGGPTDAVIPPLALIDDQGQAHTEDNHGEGVHQWLGGVRSIKPADTLEGNVVFDVAPRHYKIRVEDDSGLEHYAFIDIPLTFGSEAPVVPAAKMITSR